MRSSREIIGRGRLLWKSTTGTFSFLPFLAAAINRDGKEANAYKNVPDTTLMSSLREMILALGVVHVEPNNTDDNNVGFPVTSRTTLEAETRSGTGADKRTDARAEWGGARVSL